MRALEFITEAVLDPEGWGSTPFGKDIDYFGLRVQMKPSVFLALSKPLTSANINPDVEKHMKSGGKIAYPMLGIDIPNEWTDGDFSEPARVTGHEGRNRMTAWIRLKGDEPIQVNIKPRYLRRRSITPKMIEALGKGMIGERGNFIEHPFDATTALEEGWKDVVAGTAMALGALGSDPAIAKNIQTPAQQKALDQLITQKLQKPSTNTSAVNKKIEQPKLKQAIDPQGHEKILAKAATNAGIKGAELAQFMAQMKHESWDFTKMKEVPKKDDPKFTGYDPEHSPEKAKRLGNIKPGDGEMYRGRGYIQLTGRYNYKKAGEALNLPLEQKPDLAANPEIAAKIAVWYWRNRVKPHVTDFADTPEVTKRINTAMLDLEKRQKYFKNYLDKIKNKFKKA